jgi:hypothetical protein
MRKPFIVVLKRKIYLYRRKFDYMADSLKYRLTSGKPSKGSYYARKRKLVED